MQNCTLFPNLFWWDQLKHLRCKTQEETIHQGMQTVSFSTFLPIRRKYTNKMQEKRRHYLQLNLKRKRCYILAMTGANFSRRDWNRLSWSWSARSRGRARLQFKQLAGELGTAEFVETKPNAKQNERIWCSLWKKCSSSLPTYRQLVCKVLKYPPAGGLLLYLDAVLPNCNTGNW